MGEKEDDKALWDDVNPDDCTPSATLVHFDRPIPLLRGALPAGTCDDPSLGSFVLAFRDAASWRSAYRDTESKIKSQCMAGVRVGCAISASRTCNPPWWKKMNLFGQAPVDLAERECCEEREMEACLVSSKDHCAKLSKEKCLAAFSDARISLGPITSNLDEVTNYRASVLLKTKKGVDAKGKMG